MSDTPRVAVHANIVHMLRKDLPQILHVDREAFGHDAWPEDVFAELLRRPHVSGMIAQVEGTIAGYVIMGTHLCERLIEIMTIAVHPLYQGQGIGSALVGAAIAKAQKLSLNAINVMVDEENLSSNPGAFAFFRKMGFVAKQILKHNDEYTDIEMTLCLLPKPGDHPADCYCVECLPFPPDGPQVVS